jgi:transcriptional regulator with XRE-family HTH domain
MRTDLVRSLKLFKKYLQKSFNGAYSAQMNATDRLAARVQSLVDALGSQRALARLADVSDGTVIGWLEGAQPYPRTLKKLAERTGVTLEWLRDGKGDMTAELERLRAETKRTSAGGGKVSEEPPIYGAPDAATTIHDSIRFITKHGSVDDVRMLEDILIAARRRIQDRRRE